MTSQLHVAASFMFILKAKLRSDLMCNHEQISLKTFSREQSVRVPVFTVFACFGGDLCQHKQLATSSRDTSGL